MFSWSLSMMEGRGQRWGCETASVGCSPNRQANRAAKYGEKEHQGEMTFHITSISPIIDNDVLL